MNGRRSHPGLEFRLELLAMRIARLKLAAREESGIERIDDQIEIVALERRYGTMEKQLQALHREGGGFRSAVKSALAQVGYDLWSSIDAFLLRLESSYRPGGSSAGRR